MKPQVYSHFYKTIYNPLPETPKENLMPDLPVISHALNPTPDVISDYSRIAPLKERQKGPKTGLFSSKSGMISNIATEMERENQKLEKFSQLSNRIKKTQISSDKIEDSKKNCFNFF